LTPLYNDIIGMNIILVVSMDKENHPRMKLKKILYLERGEISASL